MRHDSHRLTEGASERTDAHHRLAEEFDAWAAAGRGDSMEKGHRPTAEQALSKIPFAQARVFLDLGCGNGYAVRHAAERMPANGVALGLDVAPQMLAAAERATERWREKAGATAADARFLHAPFDAIPLPNGTVDAVFSNEAIYYAPDVDAALAEVHRILKPYGGFWCSLDFYVENPYSHDWPKKTGLPMLLDSESGWTRRFERAGFSDVDTTRLLDPTPVDPLPEDADDDARTRHRQLLAWKHTVGTLLVVGRKE